MTVPLFPAGIALAAPLLERVFGVREAPAGDFVAVLAGLGEEPAAPVDADVPLPDAEASEVPDDILLDPALALLMSPETPSRQKALPAELPGILTEALDRLAVMLRGASEEAVPAAIPTIAVPRRRRAAATAASPLRASLPPTVAASLALGASAATETPVLPTAPAPALSPPRTDSRLHSPTARAKPELAASAIPAAAAAAPIVDASLTPAVATTVALPPAAGGSPPPAVLVAAAAPAALTLPADPALAAALSSSPPSAVAPLPPPAPEARRQSAPKDVAPQRRSVAPPASEAFRAPEVLAAPAVAPVEGQRAAELALPAAAPGDRSADRPAVPPSPAAPRPAPVAPDAPPTADIRVIAAEPGNFAVATDRLGPVRVAVAAHDTAVGIQMSVETPAAQALLGGGGTRLAEAVAAAGSRLESLSVDIRGGGGGNAGHAPDRRAETPPTPPRPARTTRAARADRFA